MLAGIAHSILLCFHAFCVKHLSSNGLAAHMLQVRAQLWKFATFREAFGCLPAHAATHSPIGACAFFVHRHAFRLSCFWASQITHAARRFAFAARFALQYTLLGSHPSRCAFRARVLEGDCENCVAALEALRLERMQNPLLPLSPKRLAAREQPRFLGTQQH